MNKKIKFKWVGVNNIEFIDKDNKSIGNISRIKLGDFMSWVYSLNGNCCLSGGLSDEVREAQKKLNLKCKKGAEPEIIYELNDIEVGGNEKT